MSESRLAFEAKKKLFEQATTKKKPSPKLPEKKRQSIAKDPKGLPAASNNTLLVTEVTGPSQSSIDTPVAKQRADMLKQIREFKQKSTTTELKPVVMNQANATEDKLAIQSSEISVGTNVSSETATTTTNNSTSTEAGNTAKPSRFESFFSKNKSILIAATLGLIFGAVLAAIALFVPPVAVFLGAFVGSNISFVAAGAIVAGSAVGGAGLFSGIVLAKKAYNASKARNASEAAMKTTEAPKNTEASSTASMKNALPISANVNTTPVSSSETELSSSSSSTSANLFANKAAVATTNEEVTQTPTKGSQLAAARRKVKDAKEKCEVVIAEQQEVLKSGLHHATVELFAAQNQQEVLETAQKTPESPSEMGSTASVIPTIQDAQLAAARQKVMDAEKKCEVVIAEEQEVLKSADSQRVSHATVELFAARNQLKALENTNNVASFKA